MTASWERGRKRSASEEDETLAFSRPVAAIAPSGDSIVAWQGGGWARYVEGWGTVSVGEAIVVPRVALGQDAALTVVNSAEGSSFQFLPSGSDEWTPAQSLSASGRVDAIEALGGGFIGVGTADGVLSAVQLSERGAQWSERVALADVERAERLHMTTHGDAAAVAWVDLQQEPATEGEAPTLVARPAARVLAFDTWSPVLELPDGAELPWVSVATGGRALAVWTELDGVSVSSYGAEQGWTEPQRLADDSQLSPAGSVDSAGNLLAVWPSSEQISVMRKPAGGDFQELAAVESQVTVRLWSHVDDQGRVNLVWQNGSGTWWTRFE